MNLLWNMQWQPVCVTARLEIVLYKLILNLYYEQFTCLHTFVLKLSVDNLFKKI